MVTSILTEALIYGIMVLGVFITFRILDFPDLTVDGSFPLGAAIMVVLIRSHFSLILALIIVFVAGILAGVVTAAIHNKLKVPNLLAGILTMTMLYSVNIRILGGSNLPVGNRVGNVKFPTVLTRVTDLFPFLNADFVVVIFFLLFTIVLLTILNVFFHTDVGLALRAMGNNQQLIINQGINPALIKTIGVGLSNGLVALSGAFAAQYQNSANANLGQGIVIVGLASVMIGEVILKSRKIPVVLISVIIGTIVYQAVMYFGRSYGYLIGMQATDLKLVSGVLIVLVLFFTKTNIIKTTK